MGFVQVENYLYPARILINVDFPAPTEGKKFRCKMQPIFLQELFAIDHV